MNPIILQGFESLARRVSQISGFILRYQCFLLFSGLWPDFAKLMKSEDFLEFPRKYSFDYKINTVIYISVFIKSEHNMGNA